LYLANSPETAWAEFYRAAAELGTPPMRMFPRRLWRLAVKLAEVVDLREPAALDQLGLPPLSPSSTEWPVFQAVGERLALAGVEGLLYRSSAHTDGICLCLFEPALSNVRATAEPELVAEPPPVPRGLRT
jgi:hypothetical protein